MVQRRFSWCGSHNLLIFFAVLPVFDSQSKSAVNPYPCLKHTLANEPWKIEIVPHLDPRSVLEVVLEAHGVFGLVDVVDLLV